MSEQTGMFVALVIAPIVTGTLAAPAGAVAAWRAAAIEDPREFRFAQDKQGMLAGLAAGATTGLLLMTIASSCRDVLLMINGAGGRSARRRDWRHLRGAASARAPLGQLPGRRIHIEFLAIPRGGRAGTAGR